MATIKEKNMKSIKEKAEEYSSGYMNLDRQQVAKQALEYGANYVLDAIEEIINHPLRFVSADKTIEEGMIGELSKLVEQLKEK